LQASYPKGFVAPVFWSEDDEEVEGAILVHYHSKRGPLLVPLVVGLLHRIAISYFDVEIILEELQLQDEAEGRNHTSWRLKSKDPELSHRLRGEEKPPTSAEQEEVPEEAFSPAAYLKTFREGGHQASNLRVEEFVKRSFFNEDSDLYYALTKQQKEYLIHYWQTHKISDRYCYEIWRLKEDDPTSWISLTDLPPALNPDTIDPNTFGGMIPQRGAYPPDAEGNLVSVPPFVRVVNAHSGKETQFSVEVGRDKLLVHVLYEHPNMTGNDMISFPAAIQQQVDANELELVLVVWNTETNEPYHTFDRTDLETTTSAQLFDMVPKFMDPILIHVQVQEVAAVDDDEEEI
jgi:hypothetical protein